MSSVKFGAGKADLFLLSALCNYSTVCVCVCVCVCAVKSCDILTVKNAVVKHLYVTQYAICDRLAHRIVATVRPFAVPALHSLPSMDHTRKLDRKQSGG